MKNLGNSETDPFNLNVVNTLEVGNDLIVDDSIATNTLTTNALTTNTVSTNTITSTTLNTQNLILNGEVLSISEGDWTPVFQTYRGFRTPPGILVKENWKDQYNNVTRGTYFKIGRSVTIWFYVACTVDGFQNDVLFAPRYPIVTNLPYRCSDPSTVITLNFQAPCSVSSYPDNYVGSFPVPLVVTYEGGYSVQLGEIGSTFVPQIPPFYDPSGLDTAVLDGKTIVFECQQASRIPAVADWSKDGTVTNAPILATGTGYNLSFTAAVTYFTDE